MSMLNLDQLTATFGDEESRYLREWMELLTFPSISASPEHTGDCRGCAEWLRSHLERMGLDASLLETKTHPVVFAQALTDASRPTVLLYGHYDVQPVDPLDLWDTDPFVPTLHEGRVYARGAQDNKGQHFYALKAIETLLQRTSLSINLKVILEGEEETNSEGLAGALEEWRERLKADVLFVTDVGQVRSGVPTIVMGLRGVIHLTAELQGPSHDLHSGVHGGLCPNPATGLAHLVASLHRDNGSIAVEGFCEGITTAPQEALSLARERDFDVDAYMEQTGAPPVGGERELHPAVRVGFEPTIEVNGMVSGYGGPGCKTIIPSTARVKLSARLVPGQDPEACLRALVTHLKQHVPPGLTLRITEQGAPGPGFRLDHRSDLVEQARRVLRQLGLGESALHWEGASIPIVTALADVSGAQPLLVGFGREEDRIHAPNESFSIEQFRQGYTYVALMLQVIGEG